jgi:hypothetical protein
VLLRYVNSKLFLYSPVMHNKGQCYTMQALIVQVNDQNFYFVISISLCIIASCINMNQL